MTYDEIFSTGIIYITGVGRSGTSIVAKILSSMKPSYYLFEPALLRYRLNDDPEIIKSILFEDYFLSQITGRGINHKKKDLSYYKNSFTQQEYDRLGNINTRDDAIELIKEEKPKWIIKNPEAAPLIPYLRKIFKKITIIAIVRDCFETIQSAVKLGWFTADYCNSRMIEETIADSYTDVKAPIYINRYDGLYRWPYWTPVERAAAVWLEHTIEAKRFSDCIFFYDKICKNPEKFVLDFEEKFGLKPTYLTQRHIDSIKQHLIVKSDYKCKITYDSLSSEYLKKRLKDHNIRKEKQ